jgi:hypothetical protein
MHALTEIDARVAFRIKLETGELLLRAICVDGGGVWLQVYQVHAKHNTSHDAA